MEALTIIVIIICFIILAYFLYPLLKGKVDLPPQRVNTVIYDKTLTQKPVCKEKPSNPNLDKYFIEAKEEIPVDYDIKQVGDCPYSKPMSKDLPLANIPMCMAVSEENMNLHEI
jgi:hypothetical protein